MRAASREGARGNSSESATSPSGPSSPVCSNNNDSTLHISTAAAGYPTSGSPRTCKYRPKSPEIKVLNLHTVSSRCFEGKIRPMHVCRMVDLGCAPRYLPSRKGLESLYDTWLGGL